jgi:hypothetical protein
MPHPAPFVWLPGETGGCDARPQGRLAALELWVNGRRDNAQRQK